MVTPDFRQEVERWPFRACALKIIQHKPYGHDASRIVVRIAASAAAIISL